MRRKVTPSNLCCLFRSKPFLLPTKVASDIHLIPVSKNESTELISPGRASASNHPIAGTWLSNIFSKLIKIIRCQQQEFFFSVFNVVHNDMHDAGTNWLHVRSADVWWMVLMCFGSEVLSGLGFLLAASILEKKKSFFLPNPATKQRISEVRKQPKCNKR